EHVRLDVLHDRRCARGPRVGRPRVADDHGRAARARTLRRRPHRGGSGLRALLAFRRRAVARALRHGVPPVIVRLPAVAPLAVFLALAPAAGEALATLIAAAFGDRPVNRAVPSLLLVPFAVATGIGATLLVAYRRSTADDRARREKLDTTPHRLSKETT